MPLRRGGPNTRTLPTVLLTPPASKATDMAHLCVLKTKLWGSAEDLFLTSKYAALTGERILSTQPSHRTQKKKNTPAWDADRPTKLTRTASHNRDGPLWLSGFRAQPSAAEIAVDLLPWPWQSLKTLTIGQTCEQGEYHYFCMYIILWRWGLCWRQCYASDQISKAFIIPRSSLCQDYNLLVNHWPK